MTYSINNQILYDHRWKDWAGTKAHGPSNRYLRFLITRLLRHINASQISTILDVGCGLGENTFLLARTFPNADVTGIDFSIEGIHYAQATWNAPNVHFAHDMTSEALNSSYDLVCCFEVLEHVEDWQTLVTRLVNASHHYIALSFPVGRMRDYEINVGHLRNFSRGQIETFLHPLGFDALLVQYAGFPFYSPIFRELANLVNLNSTHDTLTTGTYGWKRKFLAEMIYISFRWMSTRRRMGDKFCSLFSNASAYQDRTP